jgi:hypothetical protein
VPKNKAGTVLVRNRKQIKFTADAPVVAFLSFFTLFQPGVKFFLLRERGSVDPLHLLIFCVALPICTGDRKQFECLQFPGVRDVRAKAKVDELRAVDVVNAGAVRYFLVDQFTF